MATKVYKHFHLFCGMGSGAAGMNDAKPELGNLNAVMQCIGGVDIDPAGVRDFNRLTGARGTVMDLASRDQYIRITGRQPPPGWKEATPDDIRRAAGGEWPDIVFLSSPCKGLSGLLSQLLSLSDKYQAMNELTVRGVWLALEAFKDKPVRLFFFENVPRIATRGRHLLDQIADLFRAYGYAWRETAHDCGEIAELAQSRKRFLGVARHIESVPAFLYEPDKKPLRAVGDVLRYMPMPGHPAGGPMHRTPSLQWKTWVRLAFVEAGGDWRSLNKLAVEDGKLRDYLIMPTVHSGMLGVTPWDSSMGTITSRGLPNNGNFAVADPRQALYSAGYGVLPWDQAAGAVAGESLPSNGRFSVADPRAPDSAAQYQQYGVRAWDQSMGTVSGQSAPGGGSYSVADPRHGGPAKHSNEFRIVAWDKAAMAVTSAHGSGQALADPRMNWGAGAHESKLHLTDWDQPHKAVTGARGPYSGATAVADPRPGWDGRHGHLHVAEFNQPSRTVTAGGKGVQGGYLSVADPRPGIQREKGDHYLTSRHYGVVPWGSNVGAVSASACHDNGPWSVADPRPMPAPTDKLVCRITALDGTWHRPFTTLELAALQSIFDPQEHWSDDPKTQAEIDRRQAAHWQEQLPLLMDGTSDQAHRERIGNAVPRAAGKAMGYVAGQTLLMADTGETFRLSATPVWVRPLAIAISVQGG